MNNCPDCNALLYEEDNGSLCCTECDWGKVKKVKLTKKERNAKYYKENREYIIQKSKEWNKANPEKVRANAKKWRENNREQARENVRKSRSKPSKS